MYLSDAERFDLNKIRLIRHAFCSCKSNLDRAGMIIDKDQLRASAAVAVHNIEL